MGKPAIDLRSGNLSPGFGTLVDTQVTLSPGFSLFNVGVGLGAGNYNLWTSSYSGLGNSPFSVVYTWTLTVAAVQQAFARAIVSPNSSTKSSRSAVRIEPAATVKPKSSESTAIRRLKARAMRMAQVDAPLMILGETGTGKELIAHACHVGSRRRWEQDTKAGEAVLERTPLA